MNTTTDTSDAATTADCDSGGEKRERDRSRSRFVYDVDGDTYHHDRPKITGAEIMEAAGIPLSDGLVQLMPDGTTVTIDPDDTVRLVPRAQFKRRPRFKRGSK